MTETKWTPGPWLPKFQKADVDVSTHKTTVTVCYIYPDGPFRGDITRLQSCEIIKSGIDGEEMTANAHLIATAPKLYAALEAVVRVADRDTAEFVLAKMALAEARGET